MSLYELLVFLHVLGAATWFGAAAMTLVLHEVSIRDDDRGWILTFARYEELLANVLFIPASLTTLVAGLALVWRGPYGFADGWVVAGLVLWIVLFVVGITVFAPAGARLRTAVDAHGAQSDEVRAHLLFVRRVGRIDTPVLALVLFLMTVRPF